MAMKKPVEEKAVEKPVEEKAKPPALIDMLTVQRDISTKNSQSLAGKIEALIHLETKKAK